MNDARVGVCACRYLLQLSHHDRLLLALQLDETGCVEIQIEAGILSGKNIAEWRLLAVVESERGRNGGGHESKEGKELHGGREQGEYVDSSQQSDVVVRVKETTRRVIANLRRGVAARQLPRTGRSMAIVTPQHWPGPPASLRVAVRSQTPSLVLFSHCDGRPVLCG